MPAKLLALMIAGVLSVSGVSLMGCEEQPVGPTEGPVGPMEDPADPAELPADGGGTTTTP